MIYKRNTPLFEQLTIIQRGRPFTEYTIYNLRNPAAGSSSIPEFQARFFTKWRERGRKRGQSSQVNSPVYRRATLESGLNLEDPRLGAIDRQLDACITHDAYTYEMGVETTRGSMAIATRTYLWKAGIRMPDGRRIIIYLARWMPPQKFKLGAGRLSGNAPKWHDPGILGGYVTRLCNRESLDTISSVFPFAGAPFFLPFPFVPPSLSLPSCSWRDPPRTSLFTRHAMFLPLPLVFRELATSFSPTDLSPYCRTSLCSYS